MEITGEKKKNNPKNCHYSSNLIRPIVHNPCCSATGALLLINTFIFFIVLCLFTEFFIQRRQEPKSFFQPFHQAPSPLGEIRFTEP